jgi:multidrug resistance protein
MIAPASPNLGADLGIQSPTVLALSVSIFILGYAVGPLILGPLSEVFGRCIVLQCSNLFFLAWNIGCGFAQNKSQLLAFRLLSGIGGSAPLAIGGGVIGDIWRAEERGQALSIYTLAPILGPVLGPVLGSWVAERASWRWVFWSTSIFDVVIQILGLMFLREC